ncbi:putative membrane protein [Bacillus phage BCP8-2]|uniref:Putative membrane protein n=1 Tax=Bacillus phage BCP8-2 TaxID=1129192 RepID=A0A0E3D9S7_9CAUD|nr:membrane protein [Bacillus phage BCP8-2]AHJ87143.1 putative membrane protein [Bacillus phage BCP8-2]
MNASKILIGLVVSVVLFLLFMFVVLFVPWAFPFIVILMIVFGAMAGWEHAKRNNDRH